MISRCCYFYVINAKPFDMNFACVNAAFVLLVTYVPAHGEILNEMSYFSEPSYLLDCIERIVDRFVFRVPVVFFKDEVSQVWWSDSLIKNLKKPTLIVEKKNNFDIQGFYVLFPINSESYTEIFNAKNYDKSKFLLVWSHRNNATLSFVRNIFEQFWYFQYINVIALIENQIYTFLPYTKDKCNSVGDPVLIDTWNIREKHFEFNFNLFLSSLKVHNLHGCTLKAIGNHQPPDNIMYFEKNVWNATGVGYKMLEIVSQYLNFTPIIMATNLSTDHTWYYFYEELKYVSETIYRKGADLAFGWFSYASIEIHNLDLTVELARVSSIDCFGWAVPYRAGAKPPNHAYYSYEFENVTWMLIVCVFLLTACLVYFMHKNIIFSVLSVYRILLEQPVTQHKSRNSFKMLFVNFSFYSLIITAVYKASFGSFITVSSHGRDFMNVRDILNSSLKIYGSPEMLNLLNATSVKSGILNQNLHRFNVLKPCKYEDVMSRVVRKRDIAVLGVKRSLYYHSIWEAKRIKVKIPFRFIPGCLLRAHTTHFMFKRGSYLIEPVNVILNRLFETGVIPYWILHLGSNKISPVERFKGRTLRLRFLKEPIIILIVGYCVALLVFFLEILYYRKHARTFTKH
ncbi:uncharacterized protein LOC135835859 [Planococcus citri]|uniref:uncharacterized protein LOC135835859 n=1 Tax=Planococcus citri TaxID=170843 RepID=UPI0031F7C3F9